MTPQARDDALIQFIASAGWSDAAREPLSGDASSRRYERLKRGAEGAILMDAPPAAEAGACPPEADERARVALGYNALARLAGPDINAFVAVSRALVGAGFSAPQIFAADLENGFALVEDLGDDLYARAIQKGADEKTLYRRAVDVLLAIHRLAPQRQLPTEFRTHHLLDYDATALIAEIDLFTEWWAPLAFADAARPPDIGDMRESFREAWRDALQTIAPHSPVIVLRDYHAENLLWLPGRSGLRQTGLIDFQDAVIGHPAYDLASLLEDARRHVAPDLAEAMINRYCAAAAVENPGFDDDAFRAAYAILGAQRATKIIGIFARLATRDGKRRYLNMLPRVWRHLEHALDHPALRDLAQWYEDNAPRSARIALARAETS